MKIRQIYELSPSHHEPATHSLLRAELTLPFHGENGAGLGASHQTAWTGTIARVLDLFARITPEATLQGAQRYLAEMTRQQVAGKVA